MATTLADYQRGVLRGAVRAAFADGSARRLVLPWAAIPSVLLPAVYLAIPQPAGRRQQTLNALMAALVAALHVDLAVSLADGARTSSLNAAFAYCTGVAATWGAMWALVVLVWKDVQRDAAQVARRRRRSTEVDQEWVPGVSGVPGDPGDPGLGPGSGPASPPPHGMTTGSANGSSSSSAPSDATKDGLTQRSRSAVPSAVPSTVSPTLSAAASSTDASADASRDAHPFVVDTDVTRSLQTHEYYWQFFPAHESFLVRLGWSLDLCLAWRGAGWNFAITQIPHFPRPSLVSSGSSPAASPEGSSAAASPKDTQDVASSATTSPGGSSSFPAVDLAAIPLTSWAGFRRYPTYRAFLAARLLAILGGYAVLDLCAVLMTLDPFFVLGPPPQPYRPWSAQIDAYPTSSYVHARGHPDHPPPPPELFAMPPFLDRLYQWPAVALYSYRVFLGAAGMLGALVFILSGLQLLQLLLLGHCTPLLWLGRPRGMPGAELWALPSIFGSFAHVLHSGLAGFWGAAWHQSFRVGFVAPMQWLRRRWQQKSAATRLLALLLAFGQSALLHAAAHVTALSGHARWYRPAVFFLLSGVGLVVEDALAHGLVALAATVAAAACPTRPTRPTRPPLPQRSLRMAGHVVFAFVWLWATAYWILDDMARAGLWLYEPVPFSVVRYVFFCRGDTPLAPVVSPFGSSRAGQAALRWYADDYVYWYRGEHWWQSGLAL